MESAFDVPDATDWLNTPLKDFADLESALHCQICKEFYDTPMITSCAHTFCSKCIRTSLSADGKCPACRSADQASKLRNNWAIQEVVASFLGARAAALQIARRAEEEATAPKGQRKRKRTNAPDNDDANGVEPSGRTTRSKSRRLAASQGSQAETIEIEESDGDDDFEPGEDTETVHDDGLVECPLGCGKRMKIEAVEPHLDRCEEEREREKRSKSRTPMNGFTSLKGPASKDSKPMERISELNYSLLKDSAMTKKLNELGIPQWGTKQMMVNRHREWVNLWNSNCDSSKPRGKRELLHDLDVWERTQGGRAPTANGLSNSIMRKDFDGAGWAKKNHDDFNRLIADAKRKNLNPATQAEPSKSDEASDADQVPPVSADATQANQQASSEPQSSNSDHSKPYADGSAALSAVREKVDALSSEKHIEPVMNAGFNRKPYSDVVPNASQPKSSADASYSTSSPQPTQHASTTSDPSTAACSLPTSLSMQGSKKVPMLAIPAQAFQDFDGSAGGGDMSR